MGYILHYPMFATTMATMGIHAKQKKCSVLYAQNMGGTKQVNGNKLIEMMEICGVTPYQGSTSHAIAMFTLIVGDNNWRRLVDDILQALSSHKDVDALVELIAFIQPEVAIDQMWIHVENLAVGSKQLLQFVIPQCTSIKTIHISISHAEKNRESKEIQQCIINSVDQLVMQCPADEEEVKSIILRSNLPPETLEAIKAILDRNLNVPDKYE